jgi:hypothetical protein
MEPNELESEKGKEQVLSQQIKTLGHEEETEEEVEIITPPVCPKIPQRVPLPGDVEMYDDYYWLRDRKNPKVMAHLEKENAYAKAVFPCSLACYS